MLSMRSGPCEMRDSAGAGAPISSRVSRHRQRLESPSVGRGLGPVQRYVLEALDASSDADPFAWVSARALAAERAGGAPTRAQVESVNRALRTLARRGLAELGFVWNTVPTRHPASASGTIRLAT